MDVKTAQFKRNAEAALADEQIQQSLTRAIHHFDEARDIAIREFTPERWEELRERGRTIKDHTVANLDYYLELLSKRVAEAGGVVHFARDAEEVRQIMLRLARSRGIKSAVKSKSMISEEVGLNHALEEAGVEVTETDLGEYIIQLADETPFHIIAPAMHKSKEQVSDLFVEHLDEPREEGITELAGVARRVLRPKFLAADMGISGANFAVAETGTIVLVTNEGNGSLCTSVPRIHVALMGMEKIVPDIEDMAVFLRLLARAATGQRLSTYTTFITGPRRAEDEDGPEEFHLVIVDNGRSRLLRDAALREALRCIRCGACLNICPVYRKVGGHAYGWVYSGPIGAVVTPVMVGLEEAKDLPFASSLCGACRDVCPVKIDIPHLLLKLRHMIVEEKPSKHKNSPLAERLLIHGYYLTVRDRRTFALAHRAGSIALRAFACGGRVRSFPIPPLSGWTRKRDFPALAPKTFHQIWQERLSKE